MLVRPTFKSRYRPEILSPGKVFLISEEESILLENKLYQLVVPLIDGINTSDEIAQHLQSQLSAAEVYYVLIHLEQQGYITEFEQDLSPGFAAFWDNLGLNPKIVLGHIKDANVSIEAYLKAPFGNDLTAVLIESLKSLKINVAESEILDIILTEDYLSKDLADHNQKALSSGRPWILAKPVGTTLWIGPIFVPGQTGCWQCLASRLRANRPVESLIEKHRSESFSTPASVASLPSTQQTAINLTATYVARWIAQEPEHPLLGRILTVNSVTLESQSHTLVKIPQCESCGELVLHPDRKPQSIVLQSCKKAFTTDGGHRSCSPEKTFQKLKHHISPILGVVRELKRISSEGSEWNHTYTAGHQFFNAYQSLNSLRADFNFRSGGKGKTELQAKVSALCESIERYSGVFQGNEVRKLATYQAIKECAIHPNHCMLFSENQYDNRKEWNLKASASQIIPEPFDPSQEIEWTPVWSITESKFKYLPTSYCYFSYRGKNSDFCYSDSNGSAAGNTLEEAILQGFLELVERDAVAIWWYNCIQRPGVDLDSFQELYFIGLKEFYAQNERDILVLDITTDLNIPVFVALSNGRKDDKLIYGFGAHFDPKIAILRAVTELNQSLTNLFQLEFSQDIHENQIRHYHSTKSHSQINQSHLCADTRLPLKICKDFINSSKIDLLDDILTCMNTIKNHNMEILVLDQTRPELDIKVVKVIVPGLRHFWRRLGPGRLYQAPIDLGWLSVPRREEEINLFSIES